MLRTTTARGFTHIEFLLYVSISATVLLAASAMLAILLESRIKHQTIVEVEQQGLHAMQQITQTVRNATSVISPATSTQATSLQLGVSSTTVLFTVDSNVLRMTEGAGSPIALTNTMVEVESFTITNVSRPTTPGAVRVQFTVTAVNTTGRNEYTYSKNFTGSATLR